MNNFIYSQIIKEFKLLLINNEYNLYNFSFDGYADNKVCLDIRAKKWIVYIGERGLREGIKTFDYLNDAFLQMIMYTSKDKEQVKEMSKKIEQMFIKVSKTKVTLQNADKVEKSILLVDGNQMIACRAPMTLQNCIKNHPDIVSGYVGSHARRKSRNECKAKLLETMSTIKRKKN